MRMYECSCKDTIGMFIRLKSGKRLWMCDFCKGCREMQKIKPHHGRYSIFTLRPRGEMVDTRDLKSRS